MLTTRLLIKFNNKSYLTEPALNLQDYFEGGKIPLYEIILILLESLQEFDYCS